eukprot:3623285-Rhodomonas_salina.1
MKRHPEPAALQENGCGALWYLALNADNQLKIGGAGGVETVLEAMKRHPKSAAVQKNGCRYPGTRVPGYPEVEPQRAFLELGREATPRVSI